MLARTQDTCAETWEGGRGRENRRWGWALKRETRGRAGGGWGEISLADRAGKKQSRRGTRVEERDEGGSGYVQGAG